ncbi:ATP-binding cassette domain-containing protein [Chitinasiproducens palmae]|uniref:ATP-binding cassette, subfamily B n=1 Tax=Chitinasiproducens palmae TaxID=1770053 RepID=A0A1H2PK91_9BURK|nr:ATP-binding cassette domain-containing protein [Chitinasiproducens palmae]SDV46766.1 ATP-binding cassette, subfamily B [Chitinasiproducens palmae]
MTATTSARASVRRRLFRDLWQAIWAFRGRTLAAAALMVGAKLAGVSVPLLLRELVDELAHPAAMVLFPVFLVLAYAIVRFLGDALGEARDVTFSLVTQRTVAAFTSRVVSHLHTMGARFHARRETGAVVRDVQKGADGIGYLLGTALFTIVPALIEIGAVVAIMVAGYPFNFILIIAATFVAYAVCTTIFTRRRMVVQRTVNQLEAQSDSRLVDSLLNQDTVKYFATEHVESERLNAILERWVHARLANQRALTQLHVAQSAVIALGIAAMMLLAVQHVAVGRMSVGDLVLVNAYIIQVCMPLNALGFVFRETNDALVNVERMFAILDAERRPGEDVDDPDAQPLRLQAGDIVFDNVSFGYEASRPILRDVSFRAYAGKTLAVVGGSGSGKSTLVKLLFRLYAPDAGAITIDGQDLRGLTQRSLREAIGIVPQDTVLFNETIAYNIAYGRPDATRAEIVRAARAAQLDEFIERLPDHYDTRVGERGVRLSGGERQRIAIARAILKDPRIIVFDEATSALDTRSERAIQNELTSLAEGRTSVVIAHRLSTVVDADWILVMEFGRVVEQGTHQQLIAQGGVYAQMWSLQRQQGELEHAQRKLGAEPVALAAFVAGVADALAPEIADAQVRLETVVATGQLSATANPEQLQRAIVRLCEAEIERAAPGDTIELRIDRRDNDALLSAVGSHPEPAPISAQLARRIEAGLAAFGGTLGLATIEGRVAYQAVLPLRPVIEAPALPAGAPLRGCTLLVVDDQEEARDALEALLDSYGAQVLLAGSATEALQLLTDLPDADWPHVVLCDIVLGDSPNGYALLGQVRSLEATRGVAAAARVPAIAMTGYSDVQDRDAAREAGFTASLTKPVLAETLLGEIALARRPPRASN